ncbi:MAG: anthranilate synthase component I [Tepidisphaeraceae bacterium]
MPRYTPDEAKFTELAETHDIVPVYRQLLADHLTPVSAFELLSRDEPNAFLLESVVGGVNVGRYSFIATRPAFTYTVTPSATPGEAKVVHQYHLGGADEPLPPTVRTTTDPLKDLFYLGSAHGIGRFARVAGLPDFTGGLVGYAGYDSARYYEPDKLNGTPADDRHLPDVCFGLYRELVIFDHVDKTVRVVANADVGLGAWGLGLGEKQTPAAFPSSPSPKPQAPSPADAYADACRRVDAIIERLKQTPKNSLGEVDPAKPLTMPFTPNQTKEQYEAAVLKGIEYIKAGDIFQFVPSMRLRAESKADPFDVYRVLRLINPSPYMFYLKTPDCTLIGSSPEVLCSVHDGKVTTRPLAGTRRRGATDAEDKALEEELLADPKERAEHIMLVDLHRNDIGRVCEIGSVKVDECMVVERYSHVMHISSNVVGQLAKDKTPFDALRVSLPVGTVSGAPKIRAMQIIDEVEPTKRGPYGGAVGYFDFAGNTDTCIALRTIVYRKTGDTGVYDVQAGAGVVADSVPASEYQESLNKAMALLKSVQLATEGL